MHTYSRVWGGGSSRITCHQLEAGQSKVTSFSMQTPAHRLHSRTQELVAHLWHTHSWTQARKPLLRLEQKESHPLSRSPGSQHWGELAEDVVSFTSFKSVAVRFYFLSQSTIPSPSWNYISGLITRAGKSITSALGMNPKPKQPHREICELSLESTLILKEMNL